MIDAAEKPIPVDPKSDIAVFLGPSLAVARAQEILTANFYPPIRHGDLYRLRASGINKFVIIDGVFDQSTPVWHREILMLLSEGFNIVGASSMGALRALELKPYGMQGFGVIYDWYDKGLIDGDDEVALFHADEYVNYAALSQPLVNIRYNLQLAQEAQVLSVEACGLILERIKLNYFGDRLIKTIYEGMSVKAADNLRSFFAEYWVDLKASDAEGVLEAVAKGLLNDPVPVLAGWYRRANPHGVEASFSIIYGACLVGRVMKPHLPLLEVLRTRKDDYETEYRLAVQEFFLIESLFANLTSVGDTALPSSRPDKFVLSRNGLTLLEWKRHQAVQGKIQDKLAVIEIEFSTLITELKRTETESVLPLTLAGMIAIGQWARDRGYPSGSEGTMMTSDAEVLKEHCCWVLEKGPAKLGYGWDPVVAVFQQLQFGDRIGELMGS